MLISSTEQGYGAFAAETLHVGDLLHAVDGRSVLEEPIKSIHGYTIGEEGSTCTLRIERGEGQDIIDVAVTRLALRDHGRQRDFMFAGSQYGSHYTETRALIVPTPRDASEDGRAELDEGIKTRDAEIQRLTRSLESERNDSEQTIATLRQKLCNAQEEASRRLAEPYPLLPIPYSYPLPPIPQLLKPNLYPLTPISSNLTPIP